VEEAFSPFHISNSVSMPQYQRDLFSVGIPLLVDPRLPVIGRPWPWRCRPVAGRLPVSLTQRSCLASTATAKEEGSNEHHQEHDKENLGDTRGGARDTTEAQYGSDNGNDQECDCPAQHGDSPYASI
jgi:hypothetical protein